MSIDKAGEQVLGFVSAAKNLSKVGELTTKVVEIADSDSWRRYTTAVGTDKWRECEFDYFLIACGLEWDDVSKIVAWSKLGESIGPMMNHDAPTEKRRPFEEAAAAWHAAGTETLGQRAARLGWTRGDAEALRTPPVSPRVRAKLAHGVTMDESARQTRKKRLLDARRKELDQLVSALSTELIDDRECLYVIDRLQEKKRDLPQASDRDQWRADAESHDWNVSQLATLWGVTRMQANRRVRQLREVA